MHVEFANSLMQGRVQSIIDHFRHNSVLSSDDLSSMSLPPHIHNQIFAVLVKAKYCSSLFRAMTRILFVCYPDLDTPIGGVKQIYRQVSLLNELGFDALSYTKSLASASLGLIHQLSH